MVGLGISEPSTLVIPPWKGSTAMPYATFQGNSHLFSPQCIPYRIHGTNRYILTYIFTYKKKQHNVGKYTFRPHGSYGKGTIKFDEFVTVAGPMTLDGTLFEFQYSQILQIFHQSFRNFKVQNRERTWWPWTSLPP